MANPLMNMMGATTGNVGGNNPLNMLQRFQEFRKQFPANANPQQVLNTMLQSGQISQAQVNQAVQMGRQMGLLK